MQNNLQITRKEEFSKSFSNILYEHKKIKNHEQLIFLCLGTDRVTGDCFGPLVGKKLEEKCKDRYLYKTIIIGSLDNILTFEKIEKEYKNIRKKYPNACFIAVDSAFGKKEQIGKIYLSKEGIVIGKGIKDSNISIGDIGIKAVVAKNTRILKHNFNMLQNVPLHIVMDMAEDVACGIFDVIEFE